MWQTKTFKTKEAFDKWVQKNSHKYQWHELAVENAWGVQFKKLRVVY